MLQKTLKIEGMHCTSCAFLIDNELEDLEGVKSAKTNFAKQEVEIEFDESKVSLNALIETINKLGYKIANKEI